MSDTDDELAELRTRIEELDTLVGALAGTIGKLQQEALTPTKWWWPDMNQAQAKDAWGLLVPWVDALVEWRGENDTRWHRRCWYAHPVALDAMTALFCEHREAYGKRGRGYEKGNWLNQTIPAMTGIIKLELQDCTYEQREYRCRVSGLLPENHRDAFIAADIAERPKLRVSGGEQIVPPDLDDL